MQIDIEKYVSRADIEDAILDGIKSYAMENAERVISNCGHHLAEDIVNRHLGDDGKQKIADKAVSVIDELTCFTIFSDGGYGRPASAARSLLDDVVRENKSILSDVVRAAIHNLSKREIVDIVKSGKVKLVVE